MGTTDRIVINPKIMLGKPVIRWTRITVELILRKLGEGATDQDLMQAYPHLTTADVHGAVNYAADTLAHEETVLVGTRTGSGASSPPRRRRGWRKVCGGWSWKLSDSHQESPGRVK